METGFSTADAILTQAMSNNGRNGGNSNWGNGGCGAPFADQGSNAVRINRNMDVNEANDRCIKEVSDANMARISAQAEEGRRENQNTVLVDKITNSEFRTSDRVNDVKDGQFQAELRSGDRLRDIEREISANAAIAASCCCDTQKAIADAAKDAAKCCCDAQLRAAEMHAATLAAIAGTTATALAVESRGIERDRNTLQAELISLKTQVACGCNCPS